MASEQTNTTQWSPEPRATMEPPAIPRVTDVPPAPALESESESEPELDPMPATRKRGRPLGSKNKKGTKRSRREAMEASANVQLSTEEKKAQRKLKEEEKKREKEGQELKKLRRGFKEALPTIEDLVDFIGTSHPPLSDSWTQSNEDALGYFPSVHEQIDDLSADVNAKNKDKHNRTTTLWKLCLRVFRCSPFELLSPRHNLVYLPVSNPEGDSPVVWNQTFCEELSHIITHNVWDGEVASLRAALQYAVICRTDDRRRWIMPPLELESGPLARLKAALQDSPDPLPSSVHEMHREARENGPSRVRCPLSNLFMQIGETAEEKKESKSASRWSDSRKCSVDGFLVYGVTIVDLRTVRQSIDSVQRVGTRVHLSTEVCYQEFLKVRSTHADPPEFKDLAEFHRRAWLHEKRQMVRAKDVDGEVGTGVDVDSQAGSRLSTLDSESTSEGAGFSDNDIMSVDGPSLDEQVPQTQDGVGLEAADVEMQNDGWTSALYTNTPIDDEDENRSEVLSSIHVVLRSETPTDDGGPSELASPTLSTRAFHGSETPSGQSTPVLGSPTLSTR